MADGMTPHEARREGSIRSNSLRRIQEDAPGAGVVIWLDIAVRDARQALRSLRRRPWLALTAIASLAIAIGANSAIFSVVDNVLLKPLPLGEPERLVVLAESFHAQAVGGNPARLRDWQNQTPALEAVCGLYTEGVVLTGEGEAERLSAMRTFGPVQRVLGVTPAIGRSFSETEERAEGTPVAMLSHKLWQRRFGGSPAILGRKLTLSGGSYTVIGVWPESMTYPEGVDVWAPAHRSFQTAGRGGNWMLVVGRQAAAASRPELQSQLDTVAGRLTAQYPDTDAGLAVRAVPLQANQTEEARLPLLVLFATVAAVLLVACVNIAGLQLARASERQRESIIRIALGAGRGALLRLYLFESAWISLFGAVLGLTLAAFGVDALKRLLPEGVPRLATVEMDWRVAMFAAAAAALCGLIFGLAPGWQSWRTGRGVTGRRNASRLRASLVAGQVAVSMMLLVTAALLARSFAEMVRIPLGFRPAGVLALSVHFPWDTPSKRLNNFYDVALERFAALPGVASAGVVDRLPLQGGSQSSSIAVRGLELPPALRNASFGRRAASPGYFATIGVPLLRGRMFEDREGRREIVINQQMETLLFPAGGALGRVLTFDTKEAAPVWHEIVGVVGDIRQQINLARAEPEAYGPLRNTYWPMAEFVLRTHGEPGTLAIAARDVVRQIEPDQPVRSVSIMEESLRETASESRTRLWLLAGFAGTALLLAAIGLYGVLSSDVVQRTREFGVRLALGAAPSSVLRDVVRRGMALSAAGLGIGVVLALIASRFLRSLLFGVAPLDAVSYLAAAIVLLAVVLPAASLPARRAARVDPVVALRHD